MAHHRDALPTCRTYRPQSWLLPHTIGRPDATPPSLETLAQLQDAHVRTVPIENLDIHLGQPPSPAEPQPHQGRATPRRTLNQAHLETGDAGWTDKPETHAAATQPTYVPAVCQRGSPSTT